MSRISKICYALAGLFLMLVFVLYPLIGWLNLHWVMIFGAVFLMAVAALFDWRLYVDFFRMRTTKHGLNMGALILLTLTLLVCVNYLANKHNKTWDFTSEKLNSLSDQSQKVLNQLAEDAEVKVFYAGQAIAEDRNTVKQNLQVFSEASSRLRTRFINSYEENALATEYLKDVTDRDSSPLIAFLEYKGRRVRISWPMGEEQITHALIKATRSAEKKVYFVIGHGERDLAGTSGEGLTEFVRSLNEASYETASLSLLESDKIPDDAAVVAVIGPKSAFLPQEIDRLREYVLSGGRLLLAIDPLERHNLALLTKPLGVEFANDVVISVSPRISGRGEWSIAATQFNSLNEVTAPFPSGSYVVMDVASRILPAPDRRSDLAVDEIVQSSARSFAVANPQAPVPADTPMEAQTLGVMVKGQDSSSERSFSAIMFGDSDFISNKALMLYANRDLVLNSIASLTNEATLISIRPRLPQGTVLAITAINQNIFVMACIGLPIVLMILATGMWLRRRSA